MTRKRLITMYNKKEDTPLRDIDPQNLIEVQNGVYAQERGKLIEDPEIYLFYQPNLEDFSIFKRRGGNA